MQSKHELHQYSKAKKNVVLAGTLIIIVITAISAVSSFQIYGQGFEDFPSNARRALAGCAVVVVEGAFVWFLYGFTRAFSTAMERLLSLIGMVVLALVMMTNIVTHFMQAKRIPLNSFQMGWCNWGAVLVFSFVLAMVLAITLVDPAIRQLRLQIRYQGRREEAVIDAKTMGLTSDVLHEAMEARGRAEAQRLADEIMGVTSPSPVAPRAQSGQAASGIAGFAPARLNRLDASIQLGRALSDAEWDRYSASGQLPNA